MERVIYLLNADDGTSGVAPAAASRLRIGTGPCPDAMVSLWVDSANGPLRVAYDEMVREVDAGFVAYLVTESAPLPGDPVDGRRPGYTQLSFLQRPERLDQKAWLATGTTSRPPSAIDRSSLSSRWPR